MSDKLPESYIQRGLERATGMMLFGEPVESLSKRELLAALGNMANDARFAREERLRRMKVLHGLWGD